MHFVLPFGNAVKVAVRQEKVGFELVLDGHHGAVEGGWWAAWPIGKLLGGDAVDLNRSRRVAAAAVNFKDGSKTIAVGTPSFLPILVSRQP